MEIREWHLAFDGSSNHQGGGIVFVLYDPDDTDISLSFRLGFLFSDKEAEYEALMGLIFNWKFVSSGCKRIQAYHQTSQGRIYPNGDCRHPLSACCSKVNQIFLPHPVRAYVASA